MRTPGEGITFVNVIVSELAKEPGTDNSGFLPVLGVSIFCVDANGDPIFGGTGETGIFLFTVNTGLASAQVQGEVVIVNELIGEQFVFSVNVSWEATGGSQVVQSIEQFHENGFHYKRES